MESGRGQALLSQPDFSLIGAEIRYCLQHAVNSNWE